MSKCFVLTAQSMRNNSFLRKWERERETLAAVAMAANTICNVIRSIVRHAIIHINTRLYETNYTRCLCLISLSSGSSSGSSNFWISMSMSLARLADPRDWHSFSMSQDKRAFFFSVMRKFRQWNEIPTTWK